MEDAPVLIILTESDGARSRGSAEPECSKYHQLRHENRCALVLLLSADEDFSQDQDLLWSVPQRFLSHSSTFCFSEGIMYIFPFSFCLKKKKKRPQHGAVAQCCLVLQCPLTTTSHRGPGAERSSSASPAAHLPASETWSKGPFQVSCWARWWQ